METYRVWYTMEGYIDVEAESEQEALQKFGECSENELEGNLFCGAQVSDVIEQ